jgi:hypothetical protein
MSQSLLAATAPSQKELVMLGAIIFAVILVSWSIPIVMMLSSKDGGKNFHW